MRKLNLEELKSLVGVQEPAVTIYLKFTGNRIIDFENVDRVMAQVFAEARQKYPEFADVFCAPELSPLFAARSAVDSWNCGVYFKSASVEGFYPLRELCIELAVVGENFYLKPLFSLIQFDQKYKVVWLQEASIKVYAGNAKRLTLVKDLVDQEHAWEVARSLYGRRSLFSPVTNEGGAGDDQDVSRLKEEISRFYKRTERIVRRDFLDGTEPVVLMGERPLLEVFLDANRRRTEFVRVLNTSEVGISETQTAHLKSMEAVALQSQKPAADRALSRLTLRKMGEVVDSLVHVAGAAARGEVKSLIMRGGVNIWGKINRVTGRVIVETARIDAFSNDLLDAIGNLVLASGGEVHVVDGRDMPTNSPVLAFLGT